MFLSYLNRNVGTYEEMTLPKETRRLKNLINGSMETKDIFGIWILKHRDEVYSDEQDEMVFKDEPEDFVKPETEILYFPDDGSLVFQIGIRKRTEEEIIAMDSNVPYEGIYCFPGEFNWEKKELFIAEPGKLKLKDNGQMHITLSSEDYVCQEVWEKMKNVDSELYSFLEAYIAED